MHLPHYEILAVNGLRKFGYRVFGSVFPRVQGPVHFLDMEIVTQFV